MVHTQHWRDPAEPYTNARLRTRGGKTAAVPQGATRATVQPGSVTFVQRFGGSINAHGHCHVVFLAGVCVERTTQGLQPRFLPAAPPTDTDIATVLQPIRRRVLRQLRQRGYLDAATEAVGPTGDDPARDDEPALARPLAASVPPRLACGDRAGQQGRRIGAGCGAAGARPPLPGPRCASVNGFARPATTAMPAHRRAPRARLRRSTARGAVALERLAGNAAGDLLDTCTPPWSAGTTGITRSPMALLEQLAALVPLPRPPQGRDGGCLAPQSPLRAIILPSPRQPGREAPAARRRPGRGHGGASASSRWPWPAARGVSTAGGGSSPRSLRVTSSRTCGGP